MDQRPLVEGRITNFGISLDVFEFLRFVWFFLFFKKICFLGILGPPGNHTSRWIRDSWSKGVSLILAYFQMFLSFCILDDFFLFLVIFFRLSKKSGFWVVLVHPSMASVILSASVERCFVSPMRDFFLDILTHTKIYRENMDFLQKQHYHKLGYCDVFGVIKRVFGLISITPISRETCPRQLETIEVKGMVHMISM